MTEILKLINEGREDLANMLDKINKLVNTYLANHRIQLIISTVSMTFGGVLGFLAAHQSYLSSILGQETTGSTGDAISLEFIPLLINNSTVAAIMILGFVTFGLSTIITLMINGFVLGVLASDFVSQGEILYYFLLTLPHGVFELPALIIAGAVGLDMANSMIQHLRGKKEVLLSSAEIKEIQHILMITLALLVIAAVVESQVTVQIIPLLE